MGNKIRISMIFLLISSALRLWGQDSLQEHYWTSGTALNVPKGRLELGVFTASRIGLTNRLELSAHPLAFFVLPQVRLKAGWGTWSGFTLATEHGITYPTLFLQWVSAKGTGGLISPEFSFPQMFSVYNAFITSYSPFKEALLSARAGIAFAVRFGPLDPRSTIDLPVVYPRLAVFYNNPEFDLGMEFRGRFIPRFGWIFSIENFVVCGTPYNYFMENRGVISYNSKSDKLQIQAGYKLCYGRYPFGNEWQILPVLDLTLGFGGQYGKQKNQK